MGRLLNRRTKQSWWLAGEQIVGRAADCALLVEAPHVSSHHAEVRWTERGWQVKDLGSRNGTFVNDEKLEHGEWRVLRQGDITSFGDAANEQWELIDVADPDVLVVPLDGSAPFPVTDGLAGIPLDAPEATIWKDEHGCWWLEPMDKPANPLERGQVFDIGARRYRFVCDAPMSTTQLVTRSLDVTEASLGIRYSSDEEYVEAVVEHDGAQVSLGDRQHHFLLLTLARQRLDDRAQGIPEGSCGWIYVEELMDRLKMDRTRLNLDVFRLRKQFQSAGFRNAPDVIERRVQTRQLRLGFKKLALTAI